MRYASLAFVFVNILFEIDCKNTYIFPIGKKLFSFHSKKAMKGMMLLNIQSIITAIQSLF